MIAAAIGLTVLFSHTTSAASAAGFKAGEIMDDAVMTNSGSMTVSQIQSFLNSKVPTCDTNGTQSAADWGYPNLTHAQFATQVMGWPGPPYTCLKDYKQNNLSAAQIIYNTAQQYDINPEALIVLLQKESSLVTDTWPLPSQYRTATGYGCPDGAPCDSQYFGLTNQLTWGAKLYHSVLTQNPNWYSPYFVGSNPKIYWNPSTSCGYAPLSIVNWTTASLYDYTPYRPNQAALNAGYGNGDSCSSYGNRNFYLYFSDWFGSTQFPQPVGATLYRQSSTGKIYLVANSTRYYIPSPSVMSNYRLSSYGTVAASDSTIQSFTDGGSLTNIVRDSSGKIYLVNNGTRYYIPSSSVCTDWNIGCFDTNTVRNLGDDFTLSYLKSGQNLNSTAHFDGTYYKMSTGTRLPFADTSSFTQAGFSTSAAIEASASNVTQPLGPLQLSTPGVIKFSPKSTIYYFNGSSYYAVADMGVYNSLGLGSVHAINEPASSYNTTDDVPTAGILSDWYSTSNGDKYAINDGTRIKLTADQQKLWPNATYLNGLDDLVNKLPSGTLGTFVKNGSDFYQLLPSLGEKRYIAGMADYYDLGGNNSNTTRISTSLITSIKSGPFAFADGRLIKVNGDTTIYVINNGILLHVASMPVLNAYRFDTSKMKVYPVSGVDQYTKGGELSDSLTADGTAYIPYNNQLLSLPSATIQSSGLSTSSFTSVTDDMVKRASIVKVTNFLRNSDDGRIYYAANGSLHYVSSPSKLRDLGGSSVPLTPINTSILNLFTIGSPA